MSCNPLNFDGIPTKLCAQRRSRTLSAQTTLHSSVQVYELEAKWISIILTRQNYSLFDLFILSLSTFC